MRYYIVQWCHNKQGWIDLLSLASKTEKAANDDAEAFAARHHVVTRVIRKPKGWTPPHRFGHDGPAKFTLSTGKVIDVVLEQRGDWIAHEVGTDRIWATNLGPFNLIGWGGYGNLRVENVFQEDEAAP